MTSPKKSPSPNLINGIYECGLDAGNWHLWGTQVLTLLEAKCFDNGEGDEPPHGPFGHIYIDFFEANEDLNSLSDNMDQRRIPMLPRTPRRLRGPWRTHKGLDEWLDQDKVVYRRGGLFEWKSRDAVVLRVYESDGSEDGFLGRRNDVLGFERIHKAQTDGKILTLPCYRFSNSHPRRREPVVAMELKLTTHSYDFPFQPIAVVEVSSEQEASVTVRSLQAAKPYAVQVQGNYRFAGDGRMQDAVYRQQKPGDWNQARQESEKGLQIQGRCPWNIDVAPSFSPDHKYRFVALADNAGELHLHIADNKRSDNRGKLQVSVFGPL
ncbi:MAG TPA: hypothetical protein DF383_09235 [Deltaproteobacteria bacterium]|nr:hypothetical protein [Deltaproteobacteria bacterium]